MAFAIRLNLALCLGVAQALAGGLMMWTGITALAQPATPAQTAQPEKASAERGRALLLQRHETGCILCHKVPGLPQGGQLGPPLT
ncbi:MAG: hypothetical protein ACKOD9_21775, partial [Rubrivivax sp.]